MRQCFECSANRYVFRSCLNCSGSTAGSHRWSGSEFQILSPATENARGTDSWWCLAMQGQRQFLAAPLASCGHMLKEVRLQVTFLWQVDSGTGGAPIFHLGCSGSIQLTLEVLWHQMVTFKIVQCHPGLTYIFNFRHSGTLALRAERQSARMSEIKNVG